MTRNHLVDEQSLTRARKEMKERMIEIAQESGAQGVIITKRLSHGVQPHKKGTKLNQDSPMVEFAFDLVGGCGDSWALSDKPTPLDEHGNKQIIAGSVGGWEKTITFDISGDFEKQTPALVNQQIDRNGQAFGIALGMSSATSQQRTRHANTECFHAR